jgi:uncharacterized protein YutE (UPF0331/DUF86 family)
LQDGCERESLGGIVTSDGSREIRLDRIVMAIETIEESLGVLARKQRIDRETYERDSDTRDVVERRFVKTTEATLDIGTELLRYERGRVPESDPATMQTLGEIGVLSEEVAEEMAQAARFRSVLSYTYGDVIDHGVVYEALHDLERYRTFVLAVRDCLDSIDAFDG